MNDETGSALSLRDYETGDPYTETGAPSTSAGNRAVHKVANALLARAGGRRQDGKVLKAVRMEAPELLSPANQVAQMKAAMRPALNFIDLKNANEISNSLGHGATMRAVDILSTGVSIANGIPPFEPRIFPFQVVGNEFVFFPTFAICSTNGGPLPASTLFQWALSHIRISASVLNAQPGVQANLRIEFAPTSVFGDQQSVLFEIGKPTAPVEICAVHGVIAAGKPRLRNMTLAATPGLPVPGTDFPRVVVSGLDTTNFTLAYRFGLPGDRPTDKFAEYMG